MSKKQKYILTVFLSFIALFIITSIISYQDLFTYHRIDNSVYFSIKTRFIQPFYNITSLWVWCFGIILLTIYTYIFFRNTDEPLYKKFSIDLRLLFKALAIYIAILYFIGISGELFPVFYIGREELQFLSETEYRQNTTNKDIEYPSPYKNVPIEI